MKNHAKKHLFIVALVATTAASATIGTRAGNALPASPSAAIGGPTQEGWWGAAMRALCRTGISYGGILPGSPWAPITYSSCTFALFDAIF